ncbi:uncharacterized protein DSM5745_07282 [Aspergillus mulundensis]|uniref:Uncharacterized protein n=1 Tax=Aspergillus mulundensis TaxID=1810919 RepID=A0A3D8RKY8_9EURO|nr:Uncharacterized protein DSM5745_07282 [Aspergillus mulundensis]RDW74620.1 Uncharacterized protein DSM5745_07282 [Aspergillus mulundensis]
MAQFYEVYIARYPLAMQDPDVPDTGTRYHTTIFVQTSPDGSGSLHQVTGDITAPDGMTYLVQDKRVQDQIQLPHSLEKLGVTLAATYPEQWEEVLGSVPTPPQQKAFNVLTMRTEPFKTKDPLTFYEPGEERGPLVKCTEWTMDRAIPALRKAGLLLDG